MRRRLEKIRQLLASGQAPDSTAENASVLMFGSVQLGLPPGASELPPKELLAAINEELDDTPDSDVVSTAASSWSTVPGGGGKAKSTRASAPAVVGKGRKRLTRSKAFAIEVNLRGLDASFDAYSTDASLAASITTASGREQLASRIKADVAALDIIDNIKTSTWHKFLTELRPNDGGTVRPTGAPMAKVEMSSVKPIGRVAEAQEEVLLKVRRPAPSARGRCSCTRATDQGLAAAPLRRSGCARLPQRLWRVRAAQGGAAPCIRHCLVRAIARDILPCACRRDL